MYTVLEFNDSETILKLIIRKKLFLESSSSSNRKIYLQNLLKYEYRCLSLYCFSIKKYLIYRA